MQAEVTLNEETLDSELNNLASDSDLTYEVVDIFWLSAYFNFIYLLSD